jgi:hypothetical protein
VYVHKFAFVSSPPEIASLVGLGPNQTRGALPNEHDIELGFFIELGPCIRISSTVCVYDIQRALDRDAGEEEQVGFFSFIDLTGDNEGNNEVYETITVVRTRAKQLTASMLSEAEIVLETLLFLIQSTPQPSGQSCRPALRYCQHEDIP